jgi:transcriptional regulator with XRE-family HTH domain
MEKNHPKCDSISHTALRMLVRLSGIRQTVLAERFGITEVYLSNILNGKRKAKLMSLRIYKYILEVNSITQKIAA